MLVALVCVAVGAFFKLPHFVNLLFYRLKRHLAAFVQSYFESRVRAKFRQYGVIIDGDKESDFQVLDGQFFPDVAHNMAMALGETYMNGYWAPTDFSAFFDTILKDGDGLFNGIGSGRWQWWQAVALKIIRAATFNCFTFKTTSTLLRADAHGCGPLTSQISHFSCVNCKNTSGMGGTQLNQIESLAQRLQLEPGMTVLDIGCGWNDLANYLADKHGAVVTGCKLEQERGNDAQQESVNLEEKIPMIEWKNVKGRFDRIISVCSLAFVGRENYRSFFQFVSHSLKHDGIFLLQTPGVSHNGVRLSDPWTQTYLFPGLEYPYHTDIAASIDGLLVLEDWSNLDCGKTLETWLSRLEKPKLEWILGSRFYRMWRFFLHRQAAAFRSRNLRFWQIVLSKDGDSRGYDPEI